MSKTSKPIIEYRNYELSPHFPVLLLTGSKWRISDIHYRNLHFHNCLEIGICHSESGFMDFGDTAHSFHAGDVTCVSRNIPHTTYSSQGSSSLWSYIFLQPDTLLMDYFKEFLPNRNVFDAFLQNFYCIMSKEEYPLIYQLTLAIIEELLAQKPNYMLSVRGLCLSLLVEFMRVYAQSTPQTEDHSTESALVIAPALDYIRTNYMENFQMEYLADLCGLSPTHFRRTFHGIMRSTPIEFVNSTRVLNACMLLRTTADSILTISENVGFHSVSSFNRHFQEYMGVSPSEWRRQAGPMDKASILEYTGWFEPT